MTATRKSPGASICSAYTLSGDFIAYTEIASAPKKTAAVMTAPTTTANSMEHRNTRTEFRFCPAASFADTSLDTAVGRLRDETMSAMA